MKKICMDKKKKEKIDARLDELADILKRQPEGSSERLFEEIKKEEILKKKSH